MSVPAASLGFRVPAAPHFASPGPASPLPSSPQPAELGDAAGVRRGGWEQADTRAHCGGGPHGKWGGQFSGVGDTPPSLSPSTAPHPSPLPAARTLRVPLSSQSQASRPEQSVMQALESLTETQVSLGGPLDSWGAEPAQGGLFVFPGGPWGRERRGREGRGHAPRLRASLAQPPASFSSSSSTPPDLHSLLPWGPAAGGALPGFYPAGSGLTLDPISECPAGWGVGIPRPSPWPLWFPQIGLLNFCRWGGVGGAGGRGSTQPAAASSAFPDPIVPGGESPLLWPLFSAPKRGGAGVPSPGAGWAQTGC